VFFAHCNLRCVFCQNYDISQAGRPGAGRGLRPHELATLMLELQARGCHNINLVTPEHVVPQILESLGGIVDIYMPDFKLWSGERSRTWLKASDYPAVARAAIRAMHLQVGSLELDAGGLARRGVLVRHLMMPGCFDETASILGWLADELGPGTYVNLMDQYRPAGKVDGRHYPELDRRVPAAEVQKAVALAERLGLRLDQRAAVPP
jgi:putative pyruvate formate lyase activating enzyme